MGGRRGVSIISYRPVTRSDLKEKRSFSRGSVSSFLELVVARAGEDFAVKLAKKFSNVLTPLTSAFLCFWHILK